MKGIFHITIIFLFCCCFFDPGAEAARFYIWTDENGVKHISETPPEEDVGEVDSVKYKAPPPVSPQIPEPPETKSSVSEVTIKGNQVLVPVIIGYGGKKIDVTLLLDTGASITVLHENVVEKLKLKNTRDEKVQVAGGQMINARFARLDYLKSGPATVKNIDVSIIENKGSIPFDGLLGMNFLRHFKYDINFKDQSISWEK